MPISELWEAVHQREALASLGAKGIVRAFDHQGRPYFALSASREELIGALRAVALICDGYGIDVRDRLRPTLERLVPEVAQLLAGFAEGEPEDEIDALYRELRTVTADDERYRLLLTRLRSLQEAEARRMEAEFEAWRPLPRGAMDSAPADDPAG